MKIDKVLESKDFVACLLHSYGLYLTHGARSSKKVDYFHNYIKIQVEKLFKKENGYEVKLEQNVSSVNSSGRKKCDVVVNKNNIPYIVFPVKIIMTNYKQNKNNSWENLTGELLHLKWANPDVQLIPINIFMDKTPYLKKDKLISKYEEITYKDIENYNVLKEKNIVYDNINYILQVNHECKIGEEFCKIPTFIQFNKNTNYRTFSEILEELV